MDDPRAGEKMAWNMRYGWFGDGGSIKPFFWQYRSKCDLALDLVVLHVAVLRRQ